MSKNAQSDGPGARRTQPPLPRRHRRNHRGALRRRPLGAPTDRPVAHATTLATLRLPWSSESPPSPTSPPAPRPRSACANCSRRPSWPTSSGSTSSRSVSTTVRTSSISAPAVALAAVAARTERVRLSSAVTVLSSDDPVRVFQEFAEVDLISGGRAEIMAGPRLLHRVLPALRLRPRRLRRALRREARAAAEDPRQPGRQLVRAPSRAARRGRRVAAARAGPAADLGSGRRHAELRDPRRARWGSPSRSRSSAARSTASSRS